MLPKLLKENSDFSDEIVRKYYILHWFDSNIMRYNKQELFALASQTSRNFDREGVLIIKERQDSFFRRSEGKTKYFMNSSCMKCYDLFRRSL